MGATLPTPPNVTVTGTSLTASGAIGGLRELGLAPWR